MTDPLRDSWKPILPPKKHIKRLLNREKKADLTDYVHSNQKSLKSADLDKIYRMVLQTKKSEKGQELLREFVHKQAGCANMPMLDSKVPSEIRL